MKNKKTQTYQTKLLNVSRCPHIKESDEQIDGQVIYDKGRTLQICGKCVAQIIARDRVKAMSEDDK